MSYRATLRKGEEVVIESPAAFPDYTDLDECREPMILATLIFPPEYLGVWIAEDERGGHTMGVEMLSTVKRARAKAYVLACI